MIIFNILAIIFCSFLWRKGGDGFDLARNPGVPIVIGLTQLITSGYNWWLLLYIPAMWGMIQAFSYGVSAPPHKFWVWVLGKGEDGNFKPVEIATRATCGFFWSLPAILFAIFSGSWIAFSIYVVFLTIANGIIGGLVKDVDLSEKSVGAAVATCVFI